MSGYQVTTPSWFAVQSPSNIIEAQVEFLQAGYYRPSATTVYTGTAPTVTGFLGGYIIFTGTTGSFSAPAAADIISSLNTIIQTTNGSTTIPISAPVQSILRNINNVVTPGYNFPVLIRNRSSGPILFTTNSGTTVQGSPLSIAAGDIGVLDVTVTSDSTVTILSLA
jgi:hypothetical protein